MSNSHFSVLCVVFDEKMREISKKSVSFNCLKGKWFLPNTKARLKPYQLSHSN